MGPGRDRTRNPWICSQDSHLLPDTLLTAGYTARLPIMLSIILTCFGPQKIAYMLYKISYMPYKISYMPYKISYIIAI